MPRHTDKDSERVAGAIPAGSPAFWPQEDFPQGILDGDLVRYNATTELWERESEADFKAALDLGAGSHTQGTDQGLDTGGPNYVTAAQAKAGYTHSTTAHAPSDAVALATVKADADISSAISLKHAAVTLAAGATSNILALSTQELSVKAQNANLVLAGPASGAAAAPTFRALVADDLPSLSGLYLPLSGGTMTGNIVMANGGTIGQAAGPLLTFDDTGNTLQISGAKVGIGKSPTELLHLYSASYGAPVLLIDGNSPTLKLNIERPSGGAVARLMTGAYNTTSGLTAQMCTVGVLADMGTSPDPPTLTYMYFSVNAGGYDDNALRLYADKSAVFYGNVGIGTTTPLDLLTVSLAGTPTAGLWNTNFTGGNEAILRFRHGDGTADGSGDGSVAEIRSYLPGSWDCDLRFYTTNNKTLNTTPTLALTGNGDVGIATATPFDKLSVYAAAAGDYKGISIKAGDTTANSKIRVQFLDNNGVQLSSIEQPSSSAYVLSIINNQNQGIKIQAGQSSHANNIIAFLTSGANERMRLTNDGYLGIGMTAVNAALQVNLGIGIGYGSGISATHGARRSLQICTDTNYGGAYDNHSGFLLCSTMDTGWGYAQLHFCHSDGWGSYDTANPVMTLAGTGIKLNDHLLIRPILKDYGEAVNALGNLTGAKTVDLTLGNVVTGTTTGDTTWTFSNPTATGNACSFTLILTNGGSKTQTWPASVDWPGGTAPTLTSSGVDVLTFVTINAGTTWMGFLAGKDLK